MLKALFSSNTRVKLLTTFLLNPDEEYFIRELTRKLNEQINSIRRELDNLKKIGLLKSKTKNRKKFYYTNKEFPIFNELRDMFLKGSGTDDQLIRRISKMGDIDLMVLSGAFVGRESPVDLLLVGDVDKVQLQRNLVEAFKDKKEVKFTAISKKDFLYRLECKDKFVFDMVKNPKNVIAVNRMKKEIEKAEEKAA
ncbi:ArsR family transcriptional regulator [Candidatus Peregrinibacteria bacterium]|nr:ArsR family transcriptional regulator [Candidatus Peregrinibacteria bacterium]